MKDSESFQRFGQNIGKEKNFQLFGAPGCNPEAVKTLKIFECEVRRKSIVGIFEK